MGLLMHRLDLLRLHPPPEGAAQDPLALATTVEGPGNEQAVLLRTMKAMNAAVFGGLEPMLQARPAAAAAGAGTTKKQREGKGQKAAP